MDGPAQIAVQFFIQPLSQTALFVFRVGIFSGNDPVGRNLAEHGDNVFVLFRFYQKVSTFTDLADPLGSQMHQAEPVIHIFQTIFNGYTCHSNTLQLQNVNNFIYPFSPRGLYNGLVTRLFADKRGT